MPIEKEIRLKKKPTLVKTVDGVLLYCARGLGREVIILEGDAPVGVGSVSRNFLNALKKVLMIDEEPMINIAGYYTTGKWRLVIFPRRKHRPDVFFKQGNARIIISPGVIDMGGLMITPVKRDFERLDAPTVERIYREVSLEGEIAGKAIAAILWNRST
jgi:hypothetical protein